MDQVINSVARIAHQFGNSAHSFTRETWIVLSLMTVVLGYFLLRSNSDR